MDPMGSNKGELHNCVSGFNWIHSSPLSLETSGHVKLTEQRVIHRINGTNGISTYIYHRNNNMYVTTIIPSMHPIFIIACVDPMGKEKP